MAQLPPCAQPARERHWELWEEKRRPGIAWEKQEPSLPGEPGPLPVLSWEWAVAVGWETHPPPAAATERRQSYCLFRWKAQIQPVWNDGPQSSRSYRARGAAAGGCSPCKSDLPSSQTCFLPSSPSRGGRGSSLTPALPVCHKLGFAAGPREEGKAVALGTNKAPSPGAGAPRGPSAGSTVFWCHHPELQLWKGLTSASPACAFTPPASPPCWGKRKMGKIATSKLTLGSCSKLFGDQLGVA